MVFNATFNNISDTFLAMPISMSHTPPVTLQLPPP